MIFKTWNWNNARSTVFRACRKIVIHTDEIESHFDWHALLALIEYIDYKTPESALNSNIDRCHFFLTVTFLFLFDGELHKVILRQTATVSERAKSKTVK